MDSLIFAYRAVADTGFAPCVDNNFFSLACCKGGWKNGVKTGVRYWAGEALSKAKKGGKQISVYVLGYLNGHLFYAAKIDECLPMIEYYKPRGKSNGRLDAIYTTNSQGQLKRNSKLRGLHADKDQQVRDISGTYVLLSEHFAYLGKDANDSEELNTWCPKGRSAVRIENDEALVQKIEAFIARDQDVRHQPHHKLKQCGAC